MEDEAAKAEYLQLQSFITKNEDFSFKDLTELQRNILCCVLTKELVESSYDLAKEILTSCNIVSEHEQKQLTSQIVEAKKIFVDTYTAKKKKKLKMLILYFSI